MLLRGGLHGERPKVDFVLHAGDCHCPWHSSALQTAPGRVKLYSGVVSVSLTVLHAKVLGMTFADTLLRQFGFVSEFAFLSLESLLASSGSSAGERPAVLLLHLLLGMRGFRGNDFGKYANM